VAAGCYVDRPEKGVLLTLKGDSDVLKGLAVQTMVSKTPVIDNSTAKQGNVTAGRTGEEACGMY
jgi:hypothetical protein